MASIEWKRWENDLHRTERNRREETEENKMQNLVEWLWRRLDLKDKNMYRQSNAECDIAPDPFKQTKSTKSHPFPISISVVLCTPHTHTHSLVSICYSFADSTNCLEITFGASLCGGVQMCVACKLMILTTPTDTHSHTPNDCSVHFHSICSSSVPHIFLDSSNIRIVSDWRCSSARPTKRRIWILLGCVVGAA